MFHNSDVANVHLQGKKITHKTERRVRFWAFNFGCDWRVLVSANPCHFLPNIKDDAIPHLIFSSECGVLNAALSCILHVCALY